MNNISKTVINSILDHSEDDYANRLKVSKDGRDNTERHCYNIPMSSDFAEAEDASEIIDAASDTSNYNYDVTYEYEPEEENIVAEDTNSIINQAFMNYDEEDIMGKLKNNNIEEVLDKRNLITIIPTDYNTIIDENAKPINVKERMFNNIKGKQLVGFANTQSSNDYAEIDSISDDTFEMPVIDSGLNAASIPTPTTNNIYINDSQFEGNFDDALVSYNAEKQRSLNILKQYNEITTAINESDKIVRDLNNKYLIAAQKLKEAEQNNRMIEMKIVQVLSKERQRLQDQTRTAENEINDASGRLAANKTEIDELETKIATAESKISELNKRSIQQRQLLSTLDAGFIDNYNSENEIRRRVA